MYYVYREDLLGIYHIYEEKLTRDLLDEDTVFIKAFETEEEAEKFVEYVENDEDIRAIFSTDEWDYIQDIEDFYNGYL